MNVDISETIKDTELHCDESALELGAMLLLLQKMVHGKLSPVFYFSKHTTADEAKLYNYNRYT